MKSPFFELIAVQATAAAVAGTAATIAPGSGTTTTQLRNSSGRPVVRNYWTKLQTTGFAQIVANNMHDTTRNLRAAIAANSLAFQLPWDLGPKATSNETILPTIGATAVAGDVESLCVLMEYEDLGGFSGSFIDADELLKRYSGVSTTVEIELVGTAAGWTGTAAINSVTKLLRADQKYAILGITTDIACAAVAITGPCTGNYRYGIPGDPTQIERQHQMFAIASKLSGVPMIPVLNANDSSATQLSFLQDENNVSPNVTVHLALLS